MGVDKHSSSAAAELEVPVWRTFSHLDLESQAASHSRPVIPATYESEARRSQVQSQPRQFSEILE